MPQQETLGGEKFLPVFFVDEVKIGETFTSGDWPLHITLFPPLEATYQPSDGERIRFNVHAFEPFSVTAGEEAMFGPAEDVHVRKIEQSDPLNRVHKGLVRALSRLSHDPQYRMPYNPHISEVASSTPVLKGTSMLLEGLSIAVQKQRITSGGELQKTWEVVDKMRFKGISNYEYESTGEYE